MTTTVYTEGPTGMLTPIGVSDREGEAAILDILLRQHVRSAESLYVAIPDAEGVRLRVERA